MSLRLPKPPPPSSPAARRVMQGNKGRDTRPEVAIRSAIHRKGLRFRKHAAPVSGLRCTADIVFPRERLAVFVDGCFWHGCPEHGKKPSTHASYWRAKIGRNIERDKRNDTALTEAGWGVLRVWEHEPALKAADRILAAVVARRGLAESRT